MDNKNNEDLDALKIKTGVEGALKMEEALTPDGETVTLVGKDEQPEFDDSVITRIPQKSQYFGQPTLWGKSIGAFYTSRDMSQVQEQAEFHRKALKEVRRALGSKCRHLIHETDASGIIGWKAIFDINGKTKTVTVDSEVFAHELDAESYRSLNNVLLDVIGSQKTV